jgi:hypothetical protein
VLPRELSSAVVTGAIARAAWGISVLTIVLDIPVLFDVFAARGLLDRVGLPLVCLVAMVPLFLWAGLRPSTASRTLQIVGGAALAAGFMGAVLATDPTLNGDGTFLINRPAFALVLLMPTAPRPLLGLAWTTIGLGVSLGTVAIAGLIADVGFWPGWGPFTAWAVYSGAYIVLSVIQANQSSQVPDLVRLEDETRRAALEHQFEQRAAAMIQDTVLRDLTTVMSSGDHLDERTRQRFRADVQTLRNPTWLRGDGGTELVDERDSRLRNGTVALASEMQWRGLSVDVTGANDGVVRIAPAAQTALHDGLRAALENVLEHAGTGAADLIVGGDDGQLTYMVVDHGSGFDTDARAGLPATVLAALAEAGVGVRVWSMPGAGTSVLFTVTAERTGE